jgi:hypothetical protein
MEALRHAREKLGREQLKRRIERLVRLEQLDAPVLVLMSTVLLCERALWLIDPEGAAAAVGSQRGDDAAVLSGLCGACSGPCPDRSGLCSECIMEMEAEEMQDLADQISHDPNKN